MNVKPYANLTEMMRKAPIDSKTVVEFRNKALLAVDEAIDTFFKPEREVAEGKKAYDQLSDVERALRAYQGRLKADSAETRKSFDAARRSCGPQEFKGEVGATESIVEGGKPLKNGHRTVRHQVIEDGPAHGYYGSSYRVPSADQDLGRIAQVVQQMSQVLPLYGSVAMVPGPLSISLKDHIKESLQWSMKSEAQSSTRMQEEAYRLITLSARTKSVQGSSSSSSANAGSESSTTVDERVIPGLHEIRDSISQIGFAEELKGSFHRYTSINEEDLVTYQTGALWWKEDRTYWARVNSDSVLSEGEAVAVPARFNLEGLLGNEGLERPGAGADLVDAVSTGELNQDLVDTLRNRAMQIIDGATETLFNSEREVAVGRKSYDELANLQRAMTIAQDRFGAKHAYNQHGVRYRPQALPLEGLIEKLNEVAPLYACVAMVPGEMSSSVKNHAKYLFEASTQASSHSSSSSDASHISLLGSISEKQGHSSESSSSSGYVRKESQTTDERIMPVLHELRMEMDQLAIGTVDNKAVLTLNTAD